MPRLPLLLAALLLLPLHACAREVIARMGEHTLTEAEVRALARELPPGEIGVRELERLVRTEIIRRAVAAEARRQGFDKRPEVAARMEQAASQALVTAFMNDLSRPPEGFPSDEQLRQAYEVNKEALQQPRQYRLSQIYLTGTDEQVRKRAEDLAREARRRNADFAALARKSSQHAPSAGQGGDLGWLAEDNLLPAVREAVEKAGRGDIVGPVKGPEGWHVVRVVERREAQPAPFEQVREGLRNTLRLRRAAELEAAYLDGLLARTPVTVNGIALEELRRR